MAENDDGANMSEEFGADNQAGTSLLDAASSKSDLPEDHWARDYDLAEGAAGEMKKFKSVEDALNSSYEKQKMLGGMISPPKDDDIDEVRAEKMAKIRELTGVPKEATGYELVKPDNIPKGLQWNPKAEQQLREFAHANHFTQEQFNAMLKLELSQYAARQKVNAMEDADEKAAAAKQRALAIDTLKLKHGEQGHKAILEGGVAVLKHYGNDGIVKKFMDAGLDNDPEIMEMFYGMYKAEMAEDTLVPGQGQTSPTKVVGPQLNYPSMDKKK
tara:strand:+ start:2154 stop:2969 length:816 start_codon:yes stop_codon:yes gene_type:complete